MKKSIKFILAVLMIAICACVHADSIECAPDGFPTGQSSPEGVACDAIRAYLTSNHTLWLSTLVRPIYGQEQNKKYEQFKVMMVEKTKANAKDPDFPKIAIVKCYRARDFSMNGPGSVAYAAEGFIDNKFVDVIVRLNDKNEQLLRYHVLLDKDKKWYFDPRPDLAPLFSMGMNRESKSTEEIILDGAIKAQSTKLPAQ